MSSIHNILAMSGAAMSANQSWATTATSNLVNANTPGYKARKTVFAAVQDEMQQRSSAGMLQADEAVAVKVDGIIESDKPMQAKYDPYNPQADANGMVYESNVEFMSELADMKTAMNSFMAQTEIASSAKSMFLQALDLLKV